MPDYYDLVKRAEKVKVEAQDVTGQTHIYEADDLLAICMQHEIDHLEGHVFVDYLSSMKRERVRKKMLALKKDKQ